MRKFNVTVNDLIIKSYYWFPQSRILVCAPNDSEGDYIVKKRFLDVNLVSKKDKSLFFSTM